MINVASLIESAQAVNAVMSPWNMNNLCRRKALKYISTCGQPSDLCSDTAPLRHRAAGRAPGVAQG